MEGRQWYESDIDGSPDLPLTGGLVLPPIKQGIVVQQSNLWVSQQAIRLVAVQYRKELVELRWSSAPPSSAVLPRSDLQRATKLHENDEIFRQDRDQIVSTLLRVLQALPMTLVGECDVGLNPSHTVQL